MSDSSLLTRLETAHAVLHAKIGNVAPKIALVLGSGLGSFADTFRQSVKVDFKDVPYMPVSTVEGHHGAFVFGYVGDVPVITMQGRVHMYEGHDAQSVVFGLRAMLRLGAKKVIVTNAAGCTNPALEAGDLMMISDHLNLTSQNPLIGTNEASFGVRFPDMTEAYSKELRALCRSIASKQGIELREGVYAGLLGPSYETPAEVRMLHRLGADAVGMSTVLETIAARHMGAEVLGISCITNKGAGLSSSQLNHAEVTDVANRVKSRFEGLLNELVKRMGE